MLDLSLSWQIIVLAVLLVLSAFFSIAETSMMALNRYRLKAMVRLGNRAAKRTSLLLERTDRLLGVILLGNNLINAGAAALTTTVAIKLFGQGEYVLMGGTLAVTFLILVFSEITPKIIGAAYAEKIALPASYILGPLLTLLYPVVWFVNLFVSAMLWLLRMKPTTDGAAERLSAEELRSLVLEHSHVMQKKHQNILVALFDLERVTVEDVMTPRARIEAIDLDASAEQIQQQIQTSYHTRLLAYRGALAHVVGILHIRRAYAATKNGILSKPMLEELLNEPYFVPAGTAALQQLQYFQEAKQRVALVVDEYGELLGLVTLEDIIEEIVGEFTTTAPRDERFTWGEDGTLLVDAASPLRELNRKLGLDFPIDGPKTLNGLILEALQDLPDGGVSVRIGDIPVEVVQTQDRVIKIVRLFRMPRTAQRIAEDASLGV